MSKINLHNYSHLLGETKIYSGKYRCFLGFLVSRQFGRVKVQVGRGKSFKIVNFGVDKSVYLVLTVKELFPGGEAEGKSLEGT